MKDVILKFYSEHVTIQKDEKYKPYPPYFKDKDSILNSLELIRDTFKCYKRFFYETYMVDTTYYLVNFKVVKFFHVRIGNESHTFYINEEPGVEKEVDMPFGLPILERAIEKILS